MRAGWAMVAAVVAGCGGAATPPPAMATVGEASAEETAAPMPTSEQMDEVAAGLERRRLPVARCLRDAIAGGQASASTGRVKVVVALTITPSGTATDVRVDKTTLDNDVVMACVVDEVGKAELPRLAAPLPWSYTYTFQGS